MIGDPEIRIVLGQQEFEDLVRGHEVTFTGVDSGGQREHVKIILSDIGYSMMLSIVKEAMKT